MRRLRRSATPEEIFLSKNQELLTLGQASRLAACSRDTLRRAAQKEELPAEMLSGNKGPQWYIKQADLLDWLESRGKTADSAREAVDSEARILELERQVAEYAALARQAQQELQQVKKELVQASDRAGEAAAQLKVARGLVNTWTEPKRFSSLRSLFGI